MSDTGYSCFNECFYPNNFAFPYEFNRLRFTKFGSLKEVTTDLSNLLIGGVLIIRILIRDILLDKMSPDSPKNKQTPRDISSARRIQK